MLTDYSATKTQSWLSWFLRGLISLGFLVLIARLFELQIVKGSYYLQVAEENRVRRVAINAPRGQILARGGEVIAGSEPVTRRVIFDPQSGYTKVDDLTDAVQDEVVVDHKRVYNLGKSAGHLTGYLGEANEQEVGKVNPNCLEKQALALGALVGRGGLEEYYDCGLAGTDGEKLVEVDASGRIVRQIGSFDSIPGQDLMTTISFGLQEKVGQLMQGKRGAIVVTDKEGQILALYSSPSFNPTDFVSGNSEAIESVLASHDLPLFNRVIGGIFHPGSVYKPVVTIAAIEEGKVDSGFSYEDTGSIVIDEFSYSNWYFTDYGRVEGAIGIERALARSTDTFFYKVGELLGIEALVNWSHKFGLNAKTGVDLPGEVAGLVPSPDWKKKVKGERWYLGNTYHVAIGQGDLAVTPLELNQAISAIASGGKLCRPFIAQSVEVDCRDLDLSQTALDLTKNGMRQACEPGGTGFTFFDFQIGEKSENEEDPANSVRAACKTGTAETGKENISHAWFTAFAPVDFPDIVVTVLVEEGGSGAYEAGPIARAIFDYWFNLDTTGAKNSNEAPDIAVE